MQRLKAGPPSRTGRRTWFILVVMAVCAAAAAAGTIFLTQPRGSNSASVAAPELGAHLHSLVAYGPQATILVGTHGASALSTDGGKTLTKVDSLDGIDAMESGADRTGGL
ncbi:MAG: hypothetical protein ACREM6_02915 [Vulcanimicrobiaceae bacterium]